MDVFPIEVEGWRRVVRFVDEASGLHAIIAVHDDTLGPGCGGTRFRPYADIDAALDDVKRLSRGMTYKNALGGIPFGGGKAVIIGDPKTDKSPELFRAYGRAIEHFGGMYYTAEDSGVNETDLRIAAETTAYVAGVADEGKGGNPSPFTARGCWRGIEAAANARLGRNDLEGLSVSILGVGAVGMGLSQHLHGAGAKLVVADVNETAVEEACDRFGAEIVSPQEAHAADVDVYAPCALGGAINLDTINSIKAKVVAGAANNQLYTPDMDQALLDRGILYAPDYVINAAGVISVGLEILGAWSAGEMTARIDRIGDTLSRIFERAQIEGRPTGEVADEMAREVIEDARKAA
ncbi:MAG: amino acid dehydrogenase [Alphaproteobacteria bacterium]|nr:amino acid dehydrogenase [Alphaproteobacteria bacterium]